MKIEVGDDLQDISGKAALYFAELAQKAAAAQQRFTVVLSGGETPRKFYELLSAPPYADTLPWKSIHLFWGDERCVPPDHPQSNYKMVHDILLSKINVPRDNIHRIKGELEPEESAAEYENELRKFFNSGDSIPEFDFTLLGLGTNGHTASLFPKTPVLRETKKWVVGYFVEEINMSRITLTAPILNHSKAAFFLVSGQDKASMARRVIQGPYVPEELPAQLIKPENGTLVWLLDRPAATLLMGPGPINNL